jgi:hypothetical protein
MASLICKLVVGEERGVRAVTAGQRIEKGEGDMGRSFFYYYYYFLAIFTVCFDEALSKWVGCLHFEWRCCQATVLRSMGRSTTEWGDGCKDVEQSESTKSQTDSLYKALEKLLVPQLFKKFPPHFLEFQVLPPCSPQLTAWPSFCDVVLFISSHLQLCTF